MREVRGNGHDIVRSGNITDLQHVAVARPATVNGNTFVRLRVDDIEEVIVGQTYATVADSLDASLFEELGQPLSQMGARSPSPSRGRETPR